MIYYLTAAAAKEASVCPDTVRNYIRRGLIEPIRDSSGRHLYTDADVAQIRRIYLKNINRRLSTGGRIIREVDSRKSKSRR